MSDWSALRRYLHEAGDANVTCLSPTKCLIERQINSVAYRDVTQATVSWQQVVNHILIIVNQSYCWFPVFIPTGWADTFLLFCCGLAKYSVDLFLLCFSLMLLCLWHHGLQLGVRGFLLKKRTIIHFKCPYALSLRLAIYKKCSIGFILVFVQ